MFPFLYDGKQHYKCTQAQVGVSINTKPWCATSYGVGYLTVEKWGDCRKECPREGEVQGSEVFGGVNMSQLHFE